MTKKQQEQQVFEKKNFMTPVKHKNFASLQRVIYDNMCKWKFSPVLRDIVLFGVAAFETSELRKSIADI